MDNDKKLSYVEKEFLSQVRSRKNIFKTEQDRLLFDRLPLTESQKIDLLLNSPEEKESKAEPVVSVASQKVSQP